MIIPIVTIPNPILTAVALPVQTFDKDLASLIADMRETMHNADGIGLAAPQIGVSQQICILEFDSEDPDDAIPFTVLINPRITYKSVRTSTQEEACLSIPDVAGPVKRPVSIRVKAQDQDGQPLTLEASGLFARAIQHEIDHLNGILFTNYVKPSALIKRVTPDYPRSA